MSKTSVKTPNSNIDKKRGKRANIVVFDDGSWSTDEVFNVIGAYTAERFNSFEELRETWGLKPILKRTKDSEKLVKQRNRFLGVCKACGGSLSYITGTNVLSCKSETCKGMKFERSDGTEYYIPINRLLDEKGVQIAEALFY